MYFLCAAFAADVAVPSFAQDKLKTGRKVLPYPNNCYPADYKKKAWLRGMGKVQGSSLPAVNPMTWKE